MAFALNAPSTTLYDFEQLSWLPCSIISGEIIIFKRRLMRRRLSGPAFVRASLHVRPRR
jgi:hypothetical protein